MPLSEPAGADAAGADAAGADAAGPDEAGPHGAGADGAGAVSAGAVPPGREITLPGRGTTWVREAGIGHPGRPALVLLHGWTATAALNWVHAFEPLSREFRVIAIDHRGHGRGIRPSRRGFRLNDCADDVAALADALELDSIVPVGYSMGGPVALLTWRRHRDRVAGLVLCATSSQFPGPFGLVAADLAVRGGVLGVATALRTAPPILRQRATQALVERRRANGLPAWAVAEVAGNDPASLVEAFGELRAFNAGPWLADIDVPSAVIVTTDDQVVPPRRQHELAAAMPQSSVWPVDGDHTVCVSDPQLFVPALAAACRWVTAGAASRARG